jgi:hypothetical protein
VTTSFSTEKEKSEKSTLHFDVGYSADFGLMTIKENKYRFCLSINVLSAPVFSTPQFSAFPDVISSTQQVYAYSGEVSVTKHAVTNLIVGDLQISIIGDH